MEHTKEITGLRIVFENGQCSNIDWKNVEYIVCDDYITNQNNLPYHFFDNDHYPDIFIMKLKDPIPERLLLRLQRFSDVEHVDLFAKNKSNSIMVPYNDFSRQNLFKYYLQRVRRWFSKTVFLGENLNQKMIFVPDGLEIIINSNYKSNT